jgi:ATP-dependent exoDNAse (exonuclease V) beta subunit
MARLHELPRRSFSQTARDETQTTAVNLAAEIGGRFDHILVDEYQDTNRLQSKILFVEVKA